MKFMDKFHSPKIKRTPSKKGKQPDLVEKTPEKAGNKNLIWLEEKEKDVVSALRYFKTIVDKMAIDKKVLEMLPGSATKVLEAVVPLVQTDPRIQQSSAISSCYSRVYQSLANLVRWSDQVMLEGVNSEDKEVVNTVKEVIKAVLDGVKELVKLTIEKQEHPSPTSPVKPLLPACKSDSPSELPLTDREMEILNKTTGMTPSAEVSADSTDEEVAPPKPPLPCIRVAENSPPPALPPKKRQSAPSPTRVAVVAPMSRTTSGSSLPIGINRQDFDADCYAQRRLSGGSQSYGGESPRLSPYNSMGKLSKSDEQLSSLDCDSGQCSRNTSCETLDHYDPDYEFLQQDLSNADQIPQQAPGVLSPLPESLAESSSPFHGRSFQLPEHCSPSAAMQVAEIPPALPEKKRRGTAAHTFDTSGCRLLFERHPSQYDNLSEDEMHNLALIPTMHLTPFATVLPFQPGNSPAPMEFLADFASPDPAGDSEKPPPLPEKKNKHMMAYMQFVEDYSEPQPSMFYQTPQNEHIYQQKNKHLMEVYGFNDSFSSADSGQDLAPPPALPPKQRQLQASFATSSFSSVSFCVQPPQVPFGPEDSSGVSVQGLSMSISNSFLHQHSSFLVHSSENAGEEAGEGEYVNLYSSSQSNGELPHSEGESPAVRDGHSKDSASLSNTPGKENQDESKRQQKSPESLESSQLEEEVDELSLVDHNEIMSRLTLKQEGDDGPDVRGGSGDILLVHATETDRKDLVLYCEAFLTTYRTFISPEELIKKLQYRYEKFCHCPDTFKKRVSKNTFFVLVRVVDELW
ncbi:rap guanine nucleotide exchange factor 1 isoform X3 [Sphaerodactylus townsendi]|uniref:rap guanine nucleotide exchange factor 1 isoform X3 n=1 Tax=Sphaerodactylus townsendi TaxID=933632 RepID=UPI0020265B42|nr:rap guanine nucleotide exchange factor 1 isoform X3 [Sphaerodactylus townsendi]